MQRSEAGTIIAGTLIAPVIFSTLVLSPALDDTGNRFGLPGRIVPAMTLKLSFCLATRKLLDLLTHGLIQSRQERLKVSQGRPRDSFRRAMGQTGLILRSIALQLQKLQSGLRRPLFSCNHARSEFALLGRESILDVAQTFSPFQARSPRCAPDASRAAVSAAMLVRKSARSSTSWSRKFWIAGHRAMA